ncbi:MAG: hypothetical protein QM785_19275 [Pyrinomonadaceae bacterium]
MTKDVAIRVKESSLNAIASLDSLVADVKDDCETEDFERIRRAAGLSIAKIIDELLEPVYSEHPDLDPDK